MAPGIPKSGRRSASIPWWQAAILSIISFLIGRSTSSSLSFNYIYEEAGRAESTIINNASATDKDTTKCPDPIHVTKEGLVFDDEWISNPKEVMKTINLMCRLIMDKNPKESRKIGIGTILFCHTHVLTYKRAYDYSWDSLDANRTGYYTGK